jgi:hypothetical protein
VGLEVVEMRAFAVGVFSVEMPSAVATFGARIDKKLQDKINGFKNFKSYPPMD